MAARAPACSECAPSLAAVVAGSEGAVFLMLRDGTDSVTVDCLGGFDAEVTAGLLLPRNHANLS